MRQPVRLNLMLSYLWALQSFPSLLCSSSLGAMSPSLSTDADIVPAASKNDTMAPSALDLLVLTFNCAKNLLNVAVFANHMHAAFTNNAPGLPDLIVL